MKHGDSAVTADGQIGLDLPDLLAELREESSQFSALAVGSWLRVLAHARRQCAAGSRLADGAVGGVVDRDRRPLRAQTW
jgi:hypothetical protein